MSKNIQSHATIQQSKITVLHVGITFSLMVNILSPFLCCYTTVNIKPIPFSCAVTKKILALTEYKVFVVSLTDTGNFWGWS